MTEKPEEQDLKEYLRLKKIANDDAKKNEMIEEIFRQTSGQEKLKESR